MDIIRRSMDWPGLHVDVRKLCVSCPFCQKAKPASTQYAPLHSLPVISEPFSRIAMDIFGPLNRTKKGNRYILVVIDYATKWLEAYASITELNLDGIRPVPYPKKLIDNVGCRGDF